MPLPGQLGVSGSCCEHKEFEVGSGGGRMGATHAHVDLALALWFVMKRFCWELFFLF